MSIHKKQRIENHTKMKTKYLFRKLLLIQFKFINEII